MVDTEVRVVNEFGEDVIPNGVEQGEIIVKGPGVTIEETNDGWFHTGDIGTIDKNGYINIVEPKKDIITSMGDNVSSIEIENVFYQHPAIQEIAIIATPHEDLGDILRAFIVLNEGYTVTKQELIDFSLKHLSQVNCPKEITFMDELPKTASGKILKVQLGKNL